MGCLKFSHARRPQTFKIKRAFRFWEKLIPRRSRPKLKLTQLNFRARTAATRPASRTRAQAARPQRRARSHSLAFPPALRARIGCPCLPLAAPSPCLLFPSSTFLRRHAPPGGVFHGSGATRSRQRAAPMLGCRIWSVWNVAKLCPPRRATDSSAYAWPSLVAAPPLPLPLAQAPGSLPLAPVA
jgi:hypothetical protein